MNTYRALDAVGEHYFSAGDFEHEFTATEEADWLSSGHVELVPRKYRVLSNNYEAGAQGDEVELALVVDHEAALVAGGHLVRVADANQPSGNASREEWEEYARKRGALDEDLLDEDGKELSRNELRDKFGSGS